MRDPIEVIKDYSIACPISTRALCADVGLSDREVRHIISDARCRGIPVCSDHRGYYWPRRPQDMHDTIQHIKERLDKLQDVLKGLEGYREQFCVEKILEECGV